MTAFKKDWVNQFRSDRTKEEEFVRASYVQAPLVRPRARAATPPTIVLSEDVIRALPLLMTVREVAALLRYKDTETVVGLIRGGELPAKKIGREWRIPRPALVQYITSMECVGVA